MTISPPFISIIIPAYNASTTIDECLTSINGIDYPKNRYEVIVVDNGSTDNTLEIVSRYDVKCCQEYSIRSSYAARNKGVEVSRGELLAFTDSDCIVTPSWLRNIVKHVDDQKFGCFAGEIAPYSPKTLIEKYSARHGTLRQRNTLYGSYLPYPQTANAVYRRIIFDKLGLFRADLVSGGDADIAWRMQRELGLGILFIPDAITYHKHRATVFELYRQYKKYEHGKLLWLKYYNDYVVPSIQQRRDEFAFQVTAGLKTLPRNSTRYLRNEIDFLEVVAPFLRSIMALGTLSARGGSGVYALLRYHFDTLTSLFESRICPVCSTSVQTFLPFGVLKDKDPRPNAQCPQCKSLERHRMMWLYFKKETKIFNEKIRFLHLSPEAPISESLRGLKNLEYISIDSNVRTPGDTLEVAGRQLPDAYFDAIYATHYFEHLRDDILAMRELFRLLKPGGWVALQASLTGDITIDKVVDTPSSETDHRNARPIHTRRYGNDGVLRRRMESVGFRVRAIPYPKMLGLRYIRKHGLASNEMIFCCTKP